MSSIPAHQVLTVLQVPIQSTQHKDDTNTSCISFVLFRVLHQYLFLWMFSIPAHQVLTALQVPISSHPTQGRYQPFMYLLLCYSEFFIIILFSGCSSIPAFQVLTVLPVPTQATQHKDDTLYPSVGVSPFCAL